MMDEITESVDIGEAGLRGYDLLEVLYDRLMDVVDLASDQDQATWITRDGKRVAAVVTVEMAEKLNAMYSMGKLMKMMEGKGNG
jgi:hypothetical protein